LAIVAGGMVFAVVSPAARGVSPAEVFRRVYAGSTALLLTLWIPLWMVFVFVLRRDQKRGYWRGSTAAGSLGPPELPPGT
jgi:hypothetical protein